MKALALVLLVAAGGEWPGWRGPGGRGVAASPAPTEWGPEHPNLRWRREIPGRGHSSPIVAGDLVLLTTGIAGETVPGASAVTHRMGGEEFVHPDSVGADRRVTLLLLAYDRETGEPRWERTVRDGALPHDARHRVGSYANPTPLFDGERVLAWFGSQGLHAFDFDGEPLWSLDLGGVATLGMGVGVSPLLVPSEGLVVVLNDASDKGSFIAAVDAATGAVRWRKERTQPVGWASPILVGDRIVTAGTDDVVAYDAATGAEVWRAEGLHANAVPSPVADDGVVVVATGYPSKKVMGIDAADGSALWIHARGQGYVPSPILYRGIVRLVSDGGILTALDARTGAVLHDPGRMPTPGKFFASPVAAGDFLYLTSEDGDTHVVPAGPEFRVEATNSLDEPVFASPAIHDGALYLRSVSSLYSVAEP